LANAQTLTVEPAPQLLRGRFLSAVSTAHLPLFAALAVVAGIYVPSFNDYLHGDDFLAFVDVSTMAPLPHLWDVFTFNDTNVYWRPLGHVYYLLVYHAFGLNAVAFHVTGLAIFLATLVMLYAFCLRLGLNRGVAIGAVLIFGLVPNHAVSVAWTTNAPRLLAALFALAAVMLVQEALRRKQARFEVFAFVAMVLAVLSDEVAASLTPLPVLYAWLAREPGAVRWRPHPARLIAYGALGGSIALLQLYVGREADQAPSIVALSRVEIGWHIPRQYWALAAKLALPLKDGTMLADISPAEWAAGAVLILGCLALFVFGSGRARFLVAWAFLALAPFSLWSFPIAPARYVYMAALPLAVLAAWAAVTFWSATVEAGRRRPTRWLSWPAAALGAVLACATIAGLALGSAETIKRNDAFAASAEPYRRLAEDLPAALPKLPRNSRLVIYYGVWDGALIWQNAVVRTVYRDPTLNVLSVDSSQTETSGPPRRFNDVIVYYTDKGFIVPGPTRELSADR
jgi:hypothetical protein